MLEQLARHGGFGLKATCVGDLHVDDHHTVEDVGICLGMALRQSLGDCAGIARYGHAIVPMDESLALCAVDVSGRGLSVVDLDLNAERIGTFSCELLPEFVRALALHGGLTIHIRRLAGQNAHHIAEAAFKALGRALASAVTIAHPGGSVPSTKGVL
jgi:imidazoleglycerol-phosphate dehydratase